MKYFILGSNSFAGASLVDYLLSQGHEVVGASRSPEAAPVLQAYFNNPRKAHFHFHHLDLNRNLAEIEALIKQVKPHYVVDFAGQGMVAESWANPEQWYQTNIVSKVKLHQFLKNCDFLERYVRVSTPEVYGSTPGKLKESFTYNPSTPYAVSHAAIDMSLMTFYRQHHFPVILTRFANFYGPYQQLYRIVPRTIIYALTGKNLPLHGGGHSRRAFIHGHDVARGIDLALQKGTPGEIYHFSTEEMITIRHLVEKICALLDIDFTSFVTITEDRPGKDVSYEMDSSKAKKDLQWAPQYNLDQGLAETINWIRDNLDTIKNLPLQYIHKE